MNEEPEDNGTEVRDRFARIVTVAAVTTTLAAGLVGYMESTASRESGKAAAEAQRLSVDSVGAIARAQQSTDALYVAYGLGQQQRRRAASARESAVVGGGAYAPRADVDAARWMELAARTDAAGAAISRDTGFKPVERTGANGPDRDPVFPGRFYAQALRETSRLDALRDDANERSEKLGSRGAASVAILAMLAVAVYLFGFTLSPQGRDFRRMFVTVATALALVGIGWAIGAFATTPDARSDRRSRQAAQAYGEGVAALGARDFALAERRLTKAIELRPTHAQAYRARGSAILSGGSPELAFGTVLTAPEARRRATADYGKALEINDNDPANQEAIGSQLIHRGLRENDSTTLRVAARLSENAAKALPNDPIAPLNAGLALISDGRPAAARPHFAEAIRRARSYDPEVQENILSAAFTYFELLRRRRGREVEGYVRSAKEFFVARAYGRGRPGRVEGLGGLRILGTPAYLQITVDRPALRAPQGALTVQWYERDPHGLGWFVLPQISGYLTIQEFREGDAGRLVSYLRYTNPASCVRPTRVRAEVYAHGRLAATAEAPTDYPDLRGSIDREMGVGLCRPRDWAPAPGTGGGVLAGWVSPDRRRGAYVSEVHGTPLRSLPPAEARNRQVLDAVVQGLAKRLPGRPRLEADIGSRPLMEHLAVVTRTYTYPGGRVLAAAGIDNDGRTLVGLVYGERSWFGGVRARELAVGDRGLFGRRRTEPEHIYRSFSLWGV